MLLEDGFHIVHATVADCVFVTDFVVYASSPLGVN